MFKKGEWATEVLQLNIKYQYMYVGDVIYIIKEKKSSNTRPFRIKHIWFRVYLWVIVYAHYWHHHQHILRYMHSFDGYILTGYPVNPEKVKKGTVLQFLCLKNCTIPNKRLISILYIPRSRRVHPEGFTETHIQVCHT